MDDSASIDIKERERINSHLEQFWSLPTWTPTMGALLISGAAPVPGATEIPGAAADLRDRGASAPQRAFHDADRVLQRWQESWEDAIEYGRATEIPTSITPFDFLWWCHEEYENDSDWTKPGWLRYWLVFTGMELAGVAPLPAPTPIVSRAAELESFATVIKTKLVQAESAPSPHPSQSADHRLMAAVIASIEQEGRSPINGSIVKAIRLADSLRPTAVWHQLRLIAVRGEHGLSLKDEDTLWIPSGERDGENLFKKSFGQLLRRHRTKAKGRLSESE